jgi:hypothetical protein
LRSPKAISRAEALALLAILTVATLLRIWRLDLAEIGFDEAAVASLVMAWKLDGLTPLTGIVSSIGLPNPPAWPYLVAPVLLTFGTPQALVAEGVALGVATVALTWWVARRWFGVWGGLAAAAFYGGSFWSIVLGRGAWQPLFLQPLTLLCLDALLVLAFVKRPWLLVVGCGWLGLMVQLHYIAISYVVLVPVAAWLGRACLRPVHIAAALLVFALMLLPFGIYEVLPTIGLRDIGLLAQQGTGGAQVDLEAWNQFWAAAGNGGASGLVGNQGAGGLFGRWVLLGLAGDVLLAGGMLALLPSGVGRFVLAWLLVPVVFLTRHTLGILPHYLWIELPAMSLAIAALARSFSRTRVLRTGLVALLAVYVGVSAATLAIVLAYVDRSGERIGHGIPLRFTLAAADAARGVLPPGGHVLVGGPALETPVLRFTLGFDTPSRSFDDCAAPPLEGGAVYLFTREHSPASDGLIAAGAPMLARVPRGEDAFIVLGSPTSAPEVQANSAVCSR